jgi:hypothetical protein
MMNLLPCLFLNQEDIVPKGATPVMPSDEYLMKRLFLSLADGGLTKTIPPVRGPNPQGVETLFKKR